MFILDLDLVNELPEGIKKLFGLLSLFRMLEEVPVLLLELKEEYLERSVDGLSKELNLDFVF